jgi:hypothetical protein
MFLTLKLELAEEQRQAMLLAIARLAVERPGYDWMLGEISEKLKGRDLYDKFKGSKEGELTARAALGLPRNVGEKYSSSGNRAHGAVEP